MASDNRPSVYYEGEKTVYRASSFGIPLRSLVAARLGYEPQGPPTIVREAAEEGHRMEPVVKNILAEPVHHEQREVEFEHGLVIVRGHIDGVLPRRLLEVKGVSVAGMVAWRRHRWGCRPGWAWQTSVYCCSLELERLEMAVFARGTEDVDRWDTEPVYQAHHIRERIDTVEHFVGLGMLPPADPSYQGWDGWAYLNRLESHRDDELAPALREYLALMEDERLIATQKAAAKQTICFLMGDRQKVCAQGLEATRSRNGALTVVSV